MSISLRPFQQSDESSVVALMQTLQSFFVRIDKHGEQKPFTDDAQAAAYISQALADVEKMNGAFLVAVNASNEVVGFIQGVVVTHADDVLHQLTHVSGKEGWIGLFVVKEAYRGKGIGKELLRAMQAHFQKEGCTSMRLKVASANSEAIEVYKKYGLSERNVEMALAI